MKALNFLTVCTLIFLGFSCGKAQTKETTVKLDNFEHEKISDNLYVLKAPGYNTNCGVFVGTDAILLIDPMTGTDNHQNLLNAVKTISEKPIKYVLNTHSHIDHSGANAFFSELGATIVAQENATYSASQFDVSFSNNYTIDMGNEEVELYHITAHTFDDALIYFKNSNAVFMGDTYMTNSFPHAYYGGGHLGQMAIIDKALALGNANTTIVPAHGKLASNKTELSTYKENTIKWSTRIMELHEQDKSSGEIINDQQIKQLAMAFTGSEKVWPQTINKTICFDFLGYIPFSATEMKKYEGIYNYENGQSDEIAIVNNKLLIRREGAHIYEIVAIAGNKFHVRGQVPYRYITFNTDNKSFVYDNGKESVKASRK